MNGSPIGVCSALVSSLLTIGALHAQTDTPPPNVRVIVEYIETSHELVTELMTSEHADSGPRLHARMRELTKKNKAKVLETSIVTARSGRKAIAESIMEFIYPSEYEVGGLGWTPPLLPVDAEGNIIFKKPVRPTHPPSFETRNLGVTLEIEPTVHADGQMIELRFAPEIVELLHLDTWTEYEDHWGKADWTMPVFGSSRSNTALTLFDHRFGFIGVLTPTRKSGGADTSRKILLFVRADIIPIGP
jgi:hypothetical protein